MGALSSGEGAVKEQIQDEFGVGDLLQKVAFPTHIYFVWIIRTQKELEWFSGLLEAAIEGPARKCLDVTVFFTGEVDEAKIRGISCIDHKHLGRPNWSTVFTEVKGKHNGEHVGVFLCGAAAIGEQLSVQSKKHSDAIPGEP